MKLISPFLDSCLMTVQGELISGFEVTTCELYDPSSKLIGLDCSAFPFSFPIICQEACWHFFWSLNHDTTSVKQTASQIGIIFQSGGFEKG